MRPIIKVQDLSKRYRIGRRESYRMLRDSVVETLTAPFRAIRGRLRRNGISEHNGSQSDGGADGDHIWALDRVSFEVMPGEVLGIIGRNGAGKSTLLKVLARITEPTSGQVELYGRVGSLLEVGTGFHPELTGRDNIFLSGAILGIARKFDEIVAFAEIETFVDTPVKHYSSGMYVRLAFAVAAHLETEILLVDEVLAVGDAAFQKRCLGKVGDVARAGRTVLFVSHNMGTIEALCDSSLLIRNGRVEAKGSTAEVVGLYMANELTPSAASRSLREHPGRKRGSAPTMTSIEMRSGGVAGAGAVRMGEELTLIVKYAAAEPLRPVPGFVFKSNHGVAIFCVSDRFSSQLAFCEPAARGDIVCRIDPLMLMPGTYVIDLYLGDQGGDFDVIYDAFPFEVLPADMTGTGRLPAPNFGHVYCPGTFGLIPDGVASSAGNEIDT
jgi:lipopolysaccharide transport system ATP-binding protein